MPYNTNNNKKMSMAAAAAAAAAAFVVSTPSLQTSLSISSFKLPNLTIKRTCPIHCELHRAAPGGSSNELTVSKRSLFSTCLSSAASLFLLGSTNVANAAILEADDDLELLEKVKKDRQKRIDRQLLLDSSKKETAYLQDVVYKLSQAGEAIDKEDMVAASTVLGPNTDTEWVEKANLAFTKLSSSPDEKTKVQTFNSSVSKLIAAVAQNDIKTSKEAFVASATALEEWVSLAGLASQIKGL